MLFPKPPPRIKLPKPRKVWRRADDDKVTPEVAMHVLRRDGGCMAVVLDPKCVAIYGPCRGRYGPEPISQNDLRQMTLQHIWLYQSESAKGKRPPSDRAHLITICPGHHLGGWATAHNSLELQRGHLLRLMETGRT